MGEIKWFYVGDDLFIQEFIFIFCIESVLEGDGWVIVLVECCGIVLCCDLVVIDMQEFEKLIVFVQFLFYVKVQIYGNWVEVKDFGGYKFIVC